MPRHASNGLAALRAQLASYHQSHTNLQKRVAQIGEELAAVEADLARVSGGETGGGERRGRPAKVKTGHAARSGKGTGQGGRVKGQDLASILVKVLGGASKPMGIPAIADAAKKAGYKSSSPAFRRIVGMRLSTDKRFKRAGFGEYQLAK